MEDDWKVGDLVKVYLPGRPYGAGLDPTIALALVLEKLEFIDIFSEATRVSDYYNIIVQNGPIVQRHKKNLYPADMSDEEIIRKENELPF